MPSEFEAMRWSARLTGNPIPWLLEKDTPSVRAATLQRLFDRPGNDPEVVRARRQAMRVDPIRAILEAQDAEGWWEKPGPGYSPKYRSTVWALIFLDQLGADPTDPRIQRACDYVLENTQTQSGGLGCSGVKDGGPPAPSRVLHCLNGNLISALIGLGRLDDARVEAAVDWASKAITGEGVDRYYASGTSGPGFACAANEKKPCAWGAVKELRGLARVPPQRRTRATRDAIEQGVDFLLSRNPAIADYPMPARDSKPSSAWFKMGFPSGYVADVLQNLEVFVALGRVKDPRLHDALSWVEAQQRDGRWVNRYAYNGKTIVDIERQGEPSKWVTLRACAVLKSAWQ
jgi:hypothetical protein